MCLGIPAQIVHIDDAARMLATVEVGGVRRQVNIMCIVDDQHPPDACIGDWVLLHVGFALSRIDEATVPLREAVRGFCEILGLDPLYLANEGRLVAIVPAEEADAALAAMHAHPLGNGACRIGQCTERRPGQVVMHTVLGGQRIVDMLIGDQLPRIC